MATKKSDKPSLPTKKAVISKTAGKQSAGRPKKITTGAAATAPKRRGRPPKAGLPTAVVKKSLPSAKTSSLVNAQPLSSVKPSNTEQMLYESDILHESAEATAQTVPRESKTQEKAELKNRTATAGRAKNAKQAVAADPAEPAIVSTLAVPEVASSPAVSSVAPLRFGQVKKLLLATTVLVLLLAGWYIIAHRTPNFAAENSKLIATVNKLAVLPKDETPSVTTVVDETKINQDFLKNAKKGDKVLLYFQAGRAVVYRPSSGQIVNMGPLETPKPRVFIRRGSATDNTAVIRGAIARTSDFLLASQDESPNKSYAKTVVVDVTGNRPDLAGKLAQMLHVNVVPLPAGEDRPDADLLVIVGSEVQ